jgi:hypothetical protein
VKRARLPDGTTSHDLRHHSASVLLAAASPWWPLRSAWAMRTRRSSSPADARPHRYGHLVQAAEERTRRAIDEAWRAITAPSDKSQQPADLQR